MEKENCERLFGYLRSILYDTEVETLNIEALDETYQKLGRGLQFLEKAVGEMLAYSAELSRGNLSVEYASQDNFLCVNLKNMHANLNHLTWQAKQVAEGDYSQHVSYLGEFSEAFNTMIVQLKERERLLKEETEKVKERADVIEGYNNLLIELTQKRDEWVLVVDAEKQEVMYCNKQESEEKGAHTFCEFCQHKLYFRQEILNWQGKEKHKVWEKEEGSHRIYQITTFPIEWLGRSAYNHIVVDITDEEEGKRKLEKKAYRDTATGISNRLFFKEYMGKILKEKQQATLCYLDLDGLKYVNDRFGHMEGDIYIQTFVETIQKNLKTGDIFARVGGDEFAIVILGCHKETALKELGEIMEDFAQSNKKEYPISFSYGVVEIDEQNQELSLEEIIEEADSAMYECKRKNKKKYVRS